MKTKCCKSKQVHRTKNGAVCINNNCENYLCHTEVIRGYHKWKLPAAAAVFAFYLLFTFDHFSMENKSVGFYKIEPGKRSKPLTVENLELEIKSQKILCSREVLAQMKIESGHFKSFLLKRTNNMLGMRYPFSRETKACGIYLPGKDTVITGSQEELKKYRKLNNYAVYETWQDAVADYKLWQDYSFKISDHYLRFLGKVYAEDTLYAKKIKQVASVL